jgi:hypothetical protein
MQLPTIDRTTITGGPAVVLFNDGYFFSKEPIALPLALDPFAIESDAYGPIDQRADDQPPKLPLKLVGEWEHLSILNPFLSKQVGERIFGEDVPLDLLSLTDLVITRFHAAAVSKPPDLTFAAKSVLLDTVEFTLMRKNNTARTDADSFFSKYALTGAGVYYEITYGADTTDPITFNATAAALQALLNALPGIAADGGVVVTGTYKSGYTVTWNNAGARATAFTGAFTGFPTGTAFAQTVTAAGSGGQAEVRTIAITPYTAAFGALDREKVITQPYLLGWGDDPPWDEWTTDEGITVKWSLANLEPVPNDAEGPINYMFSGIDAEVECIPQGPTEEDIAAALNLQGAGAVRGRSLNADARDLIIQNDGVYFALYGANLSAFTQRWSAKQRRVGAVKFKPTRVLSGGIIQDLAYIGVAAP